MISNRITFLFIALFASGHAFAPSLNVNSQLKQVHLPRTTSSSLQMSDGGSGGGGGGGGGTEIGKSTKKGLTTIVVDRTEQEEKQEEIIEEQWRVVLHNDEVHTFNYVIQSLCKIIGTLDRKRAFDICVLTHGSGKATITKSWKAQAMKYCLGLQRQGLTASIAPESRFGDGEGGGGGPPDASGGGSE
jgi:ATP-dependent Clp protease adapter protein ClpS